MFLRLSWIIFLSCFFTCAYSDTAVDPLPSWNEGKIKNTIIQFVREVTDPNSKNFVAPANRIATFDNDGTLWLEYPMYTEVVFALDRIKSLAPEHPEWAKEEPYKSIIENNYQHLTLQDIEKAIGVTHSGMSVQQFLDTEKEWLATTKNTHFDRIYTDLIYQPMLEVINYLRNNHFTVYIVSGGGQEFIRAYSDKTYSIPSEHVIGSAGKTKYVYRDNHPELIKSPDVLFIDDKEGKPEAINLFIGKKPIIAFGNSDGDQEMLEWTQSSGPHSLMLLVHHDDAQREYAYDEKSKVGTFSSFLMQEAKENNWQIISMKNDWKVIFPTRYAAQSIPLHDEIRPVKSITPTTIEPVKTPPRKKKRNVALRTQPHEDDYVITY